MKDIPSNLDSVDMLPSLDGDTHLGWVTIHATQRDEHRRSPLLGSQQVCQTKEVAAKNWDKTPKKEL